MECRLSQEIADIFQPESGGCQRRWIDLNADGRFFGAIDQHLADARNLAQPLAHHGVGIFKDGSSIHGFGRHGQDQNGGIRRIHLPVDRWSGKIDRQIGERCRDSLLNVTGRTIDTSVQIELEIDAAPARRADRCHLRDTGNLTQSAFQWGGQRRSDGGRVCSW